MTVFQTFLNLGKINTYRIKSLKITIPACKCLSIRNSSDDSKKFVSFDEIVERRRAEARRSIVVQVNSEKSFSELHGYCSKYASIQGMHHYKNSPEEHYILIEFSSEENLKDVIKACSAHQKNSDVMANNSPFLWFRAAPDKKRYPITPGMTLVTENGDMAVNDDELYESLMNCSTVSEQIQMLYDKTALNDLGVRLRYIVARQIESLLEGMYANLAIRPFGSTVNGFGKLGCDLDLVLTNTVTDEMSCSSRRLVFQEKRSAAARQLELAGAALELRAAGTARVLRVPAARVPILQAAHGPASLDVDLCCNNMSGVYMSELLWLLGEMDPRVRPLVFAVRRWAQSVGLTNPHPGRWITNFPLSLLVLFFLQQPAPDTQLLPPVSTLKRAAGRADVRVSEEGADFTFLRSSLPPRAPRSTPAADLEACLLQFFEFYAQFDFQEKAISIVEGVAVRKPNSQPLYVCNPLEPALNVSKNVSHEECERFKAEVRNAAWQLEGAAGAAGAGAAWGALGVLERGAARGLRRLLRAGNAHRLVSVKDLFKEDNTEEEPIGDKLKRLTPKSDSNIEQTVRHLKTQLDSAKPKNTSKNLKFKNSQVKCIEYEETKLYDCGHLKYGHF